MLTTELLKSLTEEELGLLFIIAEMIFNYQVSFNSLKVIKKSSLINILDQIKPRILDDKQEIIINFQKKLIDYN